MKRCKRKKAGTLLCLLMTSLLLPVWAGACSGQESGTASQLPRQETETVQQSQTAAVTETVQQTQTEPETKTLQQTQTEPAPESVQKAQEETAALVEAEEGGLSFTASTLTGDTFTQEELTGYDLTVFYFWQTTCGPCVYELPELASYQSALPENIQLVTLCLDDYMFPGAADKILESAGYTGITLTDGDEGFQRFYQSILYTPTVLCFDSRGNRVGEPMVGAPEDLKQAYDQLIDGAIKELGIEE